MPFAPKIRKNIIRALDDFIIPALEDAIVPQILADAPWDFSNLEHWGIRRKLLSHKELRSTQMQCFWKNQHLTASAMPYITIVYSGVYDDRVGITTKMAEDLV